MARAAASPPPWGINTLPHPTAAGTHASAHELLMSSPAALPKALVVATVGKGKPSRCARPRTHACTAARAHTRTHARAPPRRRAPTRPFLTVGPGVDLPVVAINAAVRVIEHARGTRLFPVHIEQADLGQGGTGGWLAGQAGLRATGAGGWLAS